MKTIEKTITVYVAEDGKEFTHAFECEAHNNNLKVMLEREEVLTNGLRELISKVNLHYYNEPEKFTFGFNHNGGKTDVYYEGQEFDEDFPFEIEEWDEIERQMFIRYGFVLDIPIYYWGK